MINRLIPSAAIMTGLKITPLKRFMGLLQIDSQGQSYMKSSALDLLMQLTQVMYEEEIARVRNEMLEYTTFDLGASVIFITILLPTKFPFPIHVTVTYFNFASARLLLLDSFLTC